MGTLCWHCNHYHLLTDPQCPHCGATNPNVDVERAQAELYGEAEIQMPALLREQAA